MTDPDALQPGTTDRGATLPGATEPGATSTHRDDAPTGVVALLAASGAYVLITVAQSGGSFVVVPIATGLLSPAQFGLVATGAAVAQLVRGAATAGLPSSITIHFFNRGKDVGESRSLLTAAVMIALAVGAALTGAVAAFGALTDGASTDTLALGAAIGVGAAIALDLQAWSRSVDRVALFALATLGTGVAGQAIAVVVVALFDGGAAAYLAAWAATALLAALVAMRLVPPRSPRRLERGIVRSALRLGAPTIVHTFGAVFLSVGDRFMIAWMIDSAAVGRYHAMYLLSSAGIVVAGAAGTAWAPFVLGPQDRRDRGRALRTSTSLFVVLTAAISAAAVLVAPIVLDVVGGSSYDATGLLWVAGLTGLATVPYTVYLAGQISLLGSERTMAIAGTTMIATAVNLALNAVLIGPLGLNGAALATFVAYGVLGLASAFAASRHDRHFDLPGGLIASVVAGLAVVAVIGVWLPVDGVGVVVRVVLSSAFGIAGLIYGRNALAADRVLVRGPA